LDISKKSKDAKIIDSKWVFRLKECPNGQIKEYKTHFVAKSLMQRKGFDDETF